MSKLLSVKEVSVLLNISKQRVLQLIKTNIIQAERISWGYIIREENIAGIKWKRNPGRKPKPTTCSTCGSIMVCPTCQKSVDKKCMLCGKPTMAEDSFCDECRG